MTAKEVSSLNAQVNPRALLAAMNIEPIPFISSVLKSTERPKEADEFLDQIFEIFDSVDQDLVICHMIDNYKDDLKDELRDGIEDDIRSDLKFDIDYLEESINNLSKDNQQDLFEKLDKYDEWKTSLKQDLRNDEEFLVDALKLITPKSRKAILTEIGEEEQNDITPDVNYLIRSLKELDVMQQKKVLEESGLAEQLMITAFNLVGQQYPAAIKNALQALNEQHK